jgi:NADH:ubiquinone oxidoreductase subunit F (NADH-binding)
MEFNRLESCGKCTPCRLGTKAMLEILERIAAGQGRADDIETLDYASKETIELSLCGLGQTAPVPHVNLVRYFRDEFEEHIRDRVCRTGQCQGLARRAAVAAD